MEKSLYEQLKEIMKPEDIDHDCYTSDLYCKVTPASTEIINNYTYKSNVTTFINNITHELWYDIPFAYDLYWLEKCKRG